MDGATGVARSRASVASARGRSERCWRWSPPSGALRARRAGCPPAPARACRRPAAEPRPTSCARSSPRRRRPRRSSRRPEERFRPEPVEARADDRRSATGVADVARRARGRDRRARLTARAPGLRRRDGMRYLLSVAVVGCAVRDAPLALLLAGAALLLGVAARGGEQAARRPQRHGPLARGEREGRGAPHLHPPGRTVRHVLLWGAINARTPDPNVPQVAFKADYSGGWGKYRDGSYWKTFKNACEPVRRARRSSFGVTACTAPDGSYWAVQSWQRYCRCAVSRRSGRSRERSASTSRTGAGRWRSSPSRRTSPTAATWTGLFGQLTYGGAPVYGFKTPAYNKTADGYARYVYIDTLQLGLRRRAGSATRPRCCTCATGPSATASCRRRRRPAIRRARRAARRPASSSA